MEHKNQSQKRTGKRRENVQKQGGGCFCIVRKTGPFFEKKKKRKYPNEKRTSKNAQKMPENLAVKHPNIIN
jgi:hypothetical protein